MTIPDERVVPVSQGKVLLLIIGAIAFVALGFWTFQLDPAWIASQRLYNDPALVHAFGVIAMVFFGFCGIVGVRRLVDRRPGLVLNSAGILVYSSAGSAKPIPWEEIAGFDTFAIRRQKFLVIKLVTPEKYVNSGGPLARALKRANMRMVGSPVAIASNTLKISFDELVTLCSSYLAMYRNARGR